MLGEELVSVSVLLHRICIFVWVSEQLTDTLLVIACLFAKEFSVIIYELCFLC